MDTVGRHVGPPPPLPERARRHLLDLAGSVVTLLPAVLLAILVAVVGTSGWLPHRWVIGGDAAIGAVAWVCLEVDWRRVCQDPRRRPRLPYGLAATILLAVALSMALLVGQ